MLRHTDRVRPGRLRTSQRALVCSDWLRAPGYRQPETAVRRCGNLEQQRVPGVIKSELRVDQSAEPRRGRYYPASHDLCYRI
jgi:hypothetical protein